MFGIGINIIAFVSLIVIAAVAVAYTFLFDRVSNENTQAKRIKNIRGIEENRSHNADLSKAEDSAKRRQVMQKSLQELEEKNKKNSKKLTLNQQFKQAGWKIGMKQFYIFSIFFGIVLGAVAFILGAPIYVVGAAWVLGTLGLPRWFVGFSIRRRMNKFLEEFPNSVDVIVRGIKSGLPLNDCLAIVANESKEPVAGEFRKILDTQKMGVPMTEAIMKLYQNVPLTEANFFGIVIAIQQSAGGNLSEALGNLSNVLRQRKAMKAKIQAMSAEAKASGGIIAALPIIVAVLVSLTTPEYLLPLIEHPTGNLILLGSAVWMGMGVMVMKAMINFDF
ncbi:MAG: pilus assembly protein [Hyphomicrobiales bacterium]|nr:MAG: pilus assembly protein [Hyphomicrobiales bacterium]